MRSDTPRAARKKLLLLEGTLHRLDILEAREALRSGVANSFVGQRLPGVLGFLFQHKAGTLLTSVLPLLLGRGRVSRIVRRGTLLFGAGAALLGLLERWNRARMEAGSEAEPAGNEAAGDTADKKNPGQSRD